MTCSKGRRPPFRRPRKGKRTRHDSNVRPQAPQACALILLSYGFKIKISGGGATRTHRGADARRLSTPLHCLLCGASGEEEGVGVEPTEAFKLRQFSGLLGVPVPNLPRDASGGTRTPTLAKSNGFTGRLPDRFGV